MCTILSYPMTKKAVMKASAIPASLSALQESRLRRRLRNSAPSEPWVDAQIVTKHEAAADGREVARRCFEPGIFPPGGRGTPMRWCRQCGRYTPANSLQLIEHAPLGSAPVSATLICDDCHIGDEATRHRELYDALPQLRPAGSFSFFRMADLLGARKNTR